ncbi:hypothetical protein BDV19DRAFT_384007 [Aspergillus venezuelensis]
MASNLLDPKTLLHPRQRAPSEADTVVSSNPPSSTDDTTAAPSVLEAPCLKQPCEPNPDLESASDAPGNPFGYSPDHLNNLFPKSLDTPRALAGLSVDEIGIGQGSSSSKISSNDRSRVFGRNQLPPKKPKSIWRLAWITFQEAVLVMLLVAGSISLALGIYETVGVPQNPGDPTPVDWVEGVAILAAVVIVVVVASNNDWQKEKAFVKLNTRKEIRDVKVLRSGKSMLVNVHEVVVGDVLYLEPGDMVPADGILISGQNVKCDESATGESDALKKTAGAEVFNTECKGMREPDPFIVSGSRVIEGMGTFLCTSVGVNSSFGKIMMSVRTDTESTPLQKKLEGLTVAIVKLGPQFRRLSEDELDKVIPQLQVLARSSPEDKRILAAAVGFSMGISGTEVAKEVSEIILLDDNFTFIVTALKWGRAVNNAVQKFLQFQITVNITAVILSFVTSMANDDMEPVLKAINLIMDTMAALALATDPSTDAILDRPPQLKSAPLISMNVSLTFHHKYLGPYLTLQMWKMIIGQSIFQLVVILVLYFASDRILNNNTAIEAEELQLDTIIFNVFVWMQIFNELNCRRLDNKLNVFVGIHRNRFFIVIKAIMIGLQIVIVFVGGRVFDISPGGLDGSQWAISVIIALFALPWGAVVRWFPDEWFAGVVWLIAPPFVCAYRGLANGIRWLGAGLFRRGWGPGAGSKSGSERSDIEV